MQKYFSSLIQSQTVREFDSQFTVKQFGYKDVEDYYSNATIHDKLHLIDVPLLCLSAADDPFQPVQGNLINRLSALVMLIFKMSYLK